MTDNAIMTGFPPATATRVGLDNWRQAPFNRWSLHHVREVLPTAPVRHDPDNVRVLPEASADLSDFRFRHAAADISLSQMIGDTQTDGMIVLQRGRIVFEQYHNGLKPCDQHIIFSISKSVTAVIAGILAARGQLDLEGAITQYVPEMAESAYADASVRNLLDMTAGVTFDEDYTATDGAIVRYREASGWNPRNKTAAELHMRAFLTSLDTCEVEHGTRFRYISPNSDLLGWIIERAAGVRYVDLLSEYLWQPMGAEAEAYVTIDSAGAPRTAGGLCATLRDMARLGLLMAEDGTRGDKQIIPAEWINDTRANGDREQWLAGDFADDYADWPMRYRNKWYVMGGHDAPYLGIGIHGQFLYVDPANEFVAVQFSAQPDAVSNDKERMFLNMCGALAPALA